MIDQLSPTIERYRRLQEKQGAKLFQQAMKANQLSPAIERYQRLQEKQAAKLLRQAMKANQ